MLTYLKNRLQTYHFHLRDGLNVEIRPITRTDAGHLITMFNHLSADTLYRRFHQSLEHLSAEMVTQESEGIILSATEQGRGWLAFADLPDEAGAVIGGARWAVLDAHSAEIAMTIRDDCQGRGLGSHLLGLLIDEGRKAGLKQLIGYVYADNTPVWRMIRACGLPYTVHSEGAVATITLELA